MAWTNDGHREAVKKSNEYEKQLGSDQRASVFFKAQYYQTLHVFQETIVSRNIDSEVNGYLNWIDKLPRIGILSMLLYQIYPKISLHKPGAILWKELTEQLHEYAGFSSCYHGAF